MLIQVICEILRIRLNEKIVLKYNVRQNTILIQFLYGDLDCGYSS